MLVGVSAYQRMARLPAVRNNVDALAKILTDRELWGLAPEHCQVLQDPHTIDSVLAAIHTAASQATEALVVYLAGHGLVGSDSDVLLALPAGDAGNRHLGVRYTDVRELILGCRARSKVVILDCCFSGRAMEGFMSDAPAAEVIADQVETSGTFLMTACEGTRRARAPARARFTAFSGALVHTLRNGVPGGPPLLSMDTAFEQVRKDLMARNEPVPQRRSRNDGHNFALVRNRSAGLAVPPLAAVPRRRLYISRRRIALIAVAAVAAIAGTSVGLPLLVKGDQSLGSDKPDTGANPSATSDGAAVTNAAVTGPMIAAGVLGEIASAQSGKCAEISGQKTEGNLPVTQYDCNDGPNQTFIASATERPTDFQLAFAHSRLCMAAREDLIVVQLPCSQAAPWRFRHRTTDAKKQLRYWEVRYAGTGMAGNKCLELPREGDTANFTPLRVAACTRENYQQWRTRY